MSASLVGSEMCIRDSLGSEQRSQTLFSAWLIRPRSGSPSPRFASLRLVSSPFARLPCLVSPRLALRRPAPPSPARFDEVCP
eukprot:884116-Alexandrium_andersonii.AAC.1